MSIKVKNIFVRRSKHLPPMRTQSLYLLFVSFCLVDYSTILYSPTDLFTFTFLILPSSPGYTSVTLPRVYFPLIALSSLYVTTSSTCTLRRSTCHFFRGSSNGNTSRLHRFQKESTNFWTNSTLCRGFFVFLNGPCM